MFRGKWDIDNTTTVFAGIRNFCLSLFLKTFPKKREIGLVSYTGSDSVIFCEHKDGALIRLLQSGFQQEMAWDKIEGDAQDWESEILADNTLEVGSPGMTSLDI